MPASPVNVNVAKLIKHGEKPFTGTRNKFIDNTPSWPKKKNMQRKTATLAGECQRQTLKLQHKNYAVES